MVQPTPSMDKWGPGKRVATLKVSSPLPRFPDALTTSTMVRPPFIFPIAFASIFSVRGRIRLRRGALGGGIGLGDVLNLALLAVLYNERYLRQSRFRG